MNIVRNIVDSSKWNLKCPYPMTPQFIVVHNTANDASAANEISYMRNNTNSTSFHYAVDDLGAVQGIEENRNSWNAGDGTNGLGNRQGISIEICYSLSGGTRFTASENNAVILIASILKRYGWGVDKVKKHQDFSGKYCPHRTLDLGWDRFITKVKKELIPPVITLPVPSAIKMIKPETFIANLASVSVWDLTTNPNYKAVKTLSKGEEFIAFAYIQFNGMTYYVTEYSFNKGLKNGVNQADMILKSPPIPEIPPVVPPVEPPVEPPIIVEPIEGLWQRFWKWVFSKIIRK